MKTLGVIGGLGPMATAYFLRLLTQMSDAQTDQEHMEILLYSSPSIPDRTKYILGESEISPLPKMLSAGRRLKSIGADMIAVPCVTAHYFHAELEKEIGLPVIHIIQETIACLKEAGINRVGILATDGTIRSGLLQKALSEHEIQSLVPDPEGQRSVMQIIYEEVKAGKSADMEAFRRVSEQLFGQGAQAVLLACTELSLLKRDNTLPAGYLDMLEALARTAVRRCGHLRQEYGSLICSERAQ